MDQFDHSEVEDRSLPASDDFAYRFSGNGFADQEDVTSPDCSAKIFNALRRCYRQPVQELNFKG